MPLNFPGVAGHLWFIFPLLGCIRKPSRIITEISKLSYGMYLMHIFRLGLWVTIIQRHFNLPVAIEIPLIAAATFATCVIATKLLSLLPGSYYTVGVKPSPRRASGDSEAPVTD